MVLLLTHLDCTRGKVEVVGADGVADLFQTDAKGIQLFGVEVNIYVAVRGTANGYVSDTVNAVEFVDDIVLKNSVHSRITLFGRETVNHHWHGRGVEF